MYRIIGSDGKEYGPIEADQIKRWLAEGRVNASTRVQAVGTSEWKALSEFPELMGPLATPLTPPAMGTTTWGPSPAEQVNGPAIGLIVTAALGFMAQASSFLFNLFGFAQGFRGINQDAAMNFFTGTVGIVFNVIGVVIGIVILIGALKMKKLESHGWAMASSILALVPCISPCCLVGMPMGIWALVVLAKPEVKSAFPRGTIVHG